MNAQTIRTQVRSLIGDRQDEPTDYARAVLVGLQSKPTYSGTVPAAVVANRFMRRNRVARRSRRMNQLAARR